MRRASSLTWLTLLYGALVAYASLYPFGPWERPAKGRGVPPARLKNNGQVDSKGFAAETPAFPGG